MSQSSSITNNPNSNSYLHQERQRIIQNISDPLQQQETIKLLEQDLLEGLLFSASFSTVCWMKQRIQLKEKEFEEWLEKEQIHMDASLAATEFHKKEIKEDKEKETTVVDPWKVVGEVDYDRLIDQFGCQRIGTDILILIENITGKPVHSLLRRDIFFSHRDLKQVLDLYTQKKPFYLYTGRGASSASMHLGHLIPFQLTRYFQQVFDAAVVIQITDDEKFLFKEELTQEQVAQYVDSNIRDIIACGFNVKRTFIFSNMQHIGLLYKNICRLKKKITGSTMKAAFGFTDSDNIGKFSFPPVQMAPAFASTFAEHGILPRGDMPCIVPLGIDQDVYFRVCRDVAPRLDELKPALIHSKFFPSLAGAKSKMSSTTTVDNNAINNTIFLTDTAKQIKTKINRYAFSGGGATLEDQRKNGANLEVDVAYQYLRFFLPDEEELNSIAKRYAAGEMLSSEVKQRLITLLQELVLEHQTRKAAITQEVFDAFTTVHPLF